MKYHTERERSCLFSKTTFSDIQRSPVPDLDRFSFMLSVSKDQRSFSLPEYLLDIFPDQNCPVGQDFATIIGYNFVVPYDVFD